MITKIANILSASSTLRNAGAALTLLLASFTASAQPAVDLQLAAELQDTAVLGEALNASELPRPEWRTENGKPVARLILRSSDAAAWQIDFRALALPQGAQMFLTGTDAAGNTVAVHGPYEGNGPNNVPEFATDVIAGTTLTLEIRNGNPASSEWPFSIDSVQRITAARLAELQANGLTVRPHVEPTIRKANTNPDLRSVWIGDRLVKYEVIDGRAIMEGDMILGSADDVARLASRAASSKSDKKQGHITTYEPWNAYWPSGRVAFRIIRSGSGAVTVGSLLDQNITSAVAHWNSLFPGILYTRNSETNFVTVKLVSDGCASNAIGRDLGEQFIEVSTSCSRGNLIHEFGHVLGLHHEHTRPDRNNFVTVNWSNIEWFKGHNFEIPSSGESAGSGAYDYGSVMHYPVNAFSSNGNNTLTIIGTVPAGVTVGQRNGLSAGDQATIRSLYCSGVTTSGPGVLEFEKDDASGSFSFGAPGYCNWTITTSASWIKVTSALTGSGSSTVKFTITANTSRYPRSGSIRYNGRSTVIRQEGNAIIGKPWDPNIPE